MGSTLTIIVLEKHKLAFSLGYKVSGSLVIAELFVQLLVELGAETLIDVTATTARQSTNSMR